MELMRSVARSALLLAALLAVVPLEAQKKSVAPARPAPGKAKKSALDKSILEAYIRHFFVWGAPVKVEVRDPKPSPLPGFLEVTVHASAGAAAQDETFYVSRDGQRMFRGQILDISQNPFIDDLKKLKTEFQPSLGTAGAPVVLVLFSDFQCPFCKEEAKVLRQNLLAVYPKQVRLYFKDFPLEFHKWAKTAAVAARCIFRQNPAAFWEFYDWIFEHQGEITPENVQSKLAQYASSKAAQIDGIQFGRCLETRATEAEVDKNLAEAKALGINSIPTLFINGRRLAGNQPWQNLRQIIDYEIDYQKTAQNAGEQACCEVKIPSPLNR